MSAPTKLGSPERTDEPPSRMVELVNIAREGIIYDVEVARKIGEVLLEVHYGKRELERQRPLIIEDKGAYWRVEGNWNRDQKLEGQGSFFLSIAKYDARVLDIGMWGIVHPDPSVKALLDSYLHQQKPQKS